MNKQHIVTPTESSGEPLSQIASLPLTVVSLKEGLSSSAGPVLAADRRTLSGDAACRVQPAGKGHVADVWLAGQSTSSFDVAWELVAQGCLEPWGAVVCSSQQQGRGQMRRSWHSPPGNLYVSFLLPQDPLFREDAAAVLVGYILSASLGRMGYNVFLKWPNDFVNASPAKVGGLLLEDRDGLIVAGLGLNLISAPDISHLRDTRSLPAAVLGSCDREGKEEKLFPLSLWCSLVSHAKIVYDTHVTGELFSSLMQRADSLLATKGKEVRFIDAGVESPCLCVGLGPSGGLVLIPKEGTAVEVFSGSVFL